MSTIYWATAKDSSSESESTMERSEDEVLDDEELLSESDIVSMPVDSLLLKSEDELESGW
jgi:hypothetical protein